MDMAKRAPCVLVVEADILVRYSLAEYLRDCGYHVLQACDTDEAQKLFTQRNPCILIDLILVDYATPGNGNAFSLARWVRQNYPTVEIMISGSVEAATEKAGELCESGPLLSKPYDHQLVADRIRRLLATRHRGTT
jgi:DNA-binding response OmpR family regulator